MKIASLLKIEMFVLVLATASFASAGLESREYSGLDIAISNGSLTEVMSYLNQDKKPFVTKKGVLDTPHSENDFAERMGVEALGVATGGSAEYKIHECNKDIVEALISAGALVKASHLEASAELPCPDVIEPLMNKMSDADIGTASKKFFSYMSNRLALPPETREVYAEQLEKQLAITQVLVKKIAAKCPADAVDGALCEARDAAKSLAKAADAQDAAERRAESPEGLKEQACDIQADIAREQARINQEKEIGRTSGVVDQVVLHDAGQEIVGLKKQLTAVQARYKAGAKKPLSLKTCK